MLELDIKNGKLVVQDSGEVAYTNTDGVVTDFESAFEKEKITNIQDNK